MILRTSGSVKRKLRDQLINLGLVIAATFLALVFSEVALRLSGQGPLYVSPERDRFWKYDPLLGWAQQPGQVGTFATEQFRTSVRINHAGLRDRDHTYQRSSDTKRILVLGDSFAWGYGVEEGQRFSQLLETSMGAEVINASVSGYSTDQELLWLRQEGVKYDVDLIILAMSGNDIGDVSRQLVSNIYYKPRFVLEAEQIVLSGYPVPTTSNQGKLVYYLSQRSAVANFLVQRYFELLVLYQTAERGLNPAGTPAGPTGAATEPYELTLALLNEMRSIANAQQAGFMIVANNHWWNGSAEQTYAGLLAALQKEGFPVLDVEARPGFDPQAMLIPDDGHWNAAGHAFVAAEIKQFVETNRLLAQP